MNLLNLLSFAQEVSEETTKIVTIVAIAAVGVLAVILGVLCFTYKKDDTKGIAFGAMCIACSFILSFIKVTPVAYGGSITLASFVPILIYAYVFGPIRGLVAGLVYGVLQFIQDPYMLTPVTFLLDYLLAFVGIFLIGVARYVIKNEKGAVCAGIAAAYIWRFAMHFVSGIIYFKMGAIWTNLPTSSAGLYSFLYQIVYLAPDMVITFGVMLALLFTKNFKRLVTLMRPDFYTKEKCTTAETDAA